jgi:fido (protein-threonine AMPylation protein)
MVYREALVFLTRTTWTFAQVLFAFIQIIFASTIQTYILTGTDFLASLHRFLFGQIYHQFVSLDVEIIYDFCSFQ